MVTTTPTTQAEPWWGVQGPPEADGFSLLLNHFPYDYMIKRVRTYFSQISLFFI
jgi:hypothetical protein